MSILTDEQRRLKRGKEALKEGLAQRATHKVKHKTPEYMEPSKPDQYKPESLQGREGLPQPDKSGFTNFNGKPADSPSMTTAGYQTEKNLFDQNQQLQGRQAFAKGLRDNKFDPNTATSEAKEEFLEKGKSLGLSMEQMTKFTDSYNNPQAGPPAQPVGEQAALGLQGARGLARNDGPSFKQGFGASGIQGARHYTRDERAAATEAKKTSSIFNRAYRDAKKRNDFKGAAKIQAKAEDMGIRMGGIRRGFEYEEQSAERKNEWGFQDEDMEPDSFWG